MFTNIQGTTDDTGQTSFDYAIPVDALSDFYDVTVYASADGYDNATSSTVFEVIGSDSDFFYDNSTWRRVLLMIITMMMVAASDDNCCDDNNDDDFDSPTVKSVTPNDGQNDVSLNTEIKVTFDEKMDEDTLDDGSLDIFNLDGNGIDPDVNANPSSKSVTYTLDRQLGTRD